MPLMRDMAVNTRKVGNSARQVAPVTRIYGARSMGVRRFRRARFVITEISVSRVNYSDGIEITNLILRLIAASMFIYAALFII